MKHKQKFAAALALSLPAVLGSPAWAADGGDAQDSGTDPVYGVLTAEDPVYDAAAQMALELERRTGIVDPSAPSG